MKRAIRLLLAPALITAGFVAVAVGQQTATPPAETPVPQPILWVDHNAVEGLSDVLFDLDVYQFVSEPGTLQTDAQWFKDHPDVQVNLVGYADPRGNIVHNLALAQRRANTVKQKLIEMGLPEDRIVFAVGWGKLYQSCLDSTEDCWKRNRRVQFEHAKPFANQRTGGPSR
jgi:outer membrane protein OmpA-like peptidoglycan-associated protein